MDWLEIVLLFIILIIACIFIAMVVMKRLHTEVSRPIKTGGDPSEIIHIGGPEASGKTTLAEELKKKKLNVFDLDDIFDEFKKTGRNNSEYLDFIHEKIKPYDRVVLVGLPSYKDEKDKYFEIGDVKYCIDLDVDQNTKRLFMREFGGWLSWMSHREKEILYEQLAENQEQVSNDLCTGLRRSLNIAEMRKNIESQREYFKTHSYKFLTVEEILAKI